MIELSNGIAYFEKVIPESMCDSIIEDLKKQSWVDGKYKHVYTYKMGDALAELKQLNLIVLDTLNEYLEIYRELDKDGKIPVIDQSFAFVQKFLRYQEAHDFPSHFDSVFGHQTVTVISYFNDDYEGGLLSYPKHHLSVSPKKGSIIIHPASFAYPHISSRIEKGEKFIGFTGFDLFIKRDFPGNTRK